MRFIILIFSLQISAQTDSLFRPFQNVIKQALFVPLIIPKFAFDLTLKKIKMELSPMDSALEVPSGRELIQEEIPLLSERVRDFPWEEYERLEQAQETGRLSYAEQMRWLALRAEYEILKDTPGFESQQTQSTSRQSGIKCKQVPGMRMAGSSCSGGDSKTMVQNNAGDPISDAILEADRTGELQLFELNLGDPDEIAGVIARIPDRIAKKVTRLNLDHNPIRVAVDLSRFTSLREISVAHCELTEIPEAWYRQLQVAGGRLDLSGNNITRLPEVISKQVELVIDRIGEEMSVTSAVGSLTFSGDYPDFITDGLYLGAREHLSPDILGSLKISSVFNCALELSREADQLRSRSIDVNNLRLEDSGEQMISLESEAKKVHEALTAGRKVLVNCAQGVSRSATLVIAYLMIYKEKDLLAAVTHVRECRSRINPNSGFMYQLYQLQLKRYPDQGDDRFNELLPDILQKRFRLQIPEKPNAPNSLTAKLSAFPIVEEQE